jgi:lon-related putative ATP-dependent protease
MLSPLSADEMYRASEPQAFGFETTAEVQPDAGIVGQPGATKALSFGLGMASPGYHIFVGGELGTGRASAIERLVGNMASQGERPDDWVYVYNFEAPGNPRALRLPPGEGVRFKRQMARLVDGLRLYLWAAGQAEEFARALQDNWDNLRAIRDEQFSRLWARAREAGAVFRGARGGIEVVAEQPEEGISAGQEESWRIIGDGLRREWERGLRTVNRLQEAAREARRSLFERYIGIYVRNDLESLRRLYSDNPAVLTYCEDLYADILDQLEAMASPWNQEDSFGADPNALDYGRYEINVIADHSQSRGSPVVIEFNPSVARLLGHVAHEVSQRERDGAADHRLIKAGALHAANGGYLLLRMSDLFSEADAWRTLKRALLEGEVRPDDPAAVVAPRTSELAPEAIPLRLKVILIGSPNEYYRLYEQDEDFRSLFKVMVDFNEQIDRTSESEPEYVSFIATLCAQESLRPLDVPAVGRVIEYGSWMAGSQDKLSTKFGRLADLVREADHWAGVAGHDIVDAADVNRALDERRERHDRAYSRQLEEILREMVLIATDGEAVGQVNGLTVESIGPYDYGLPSRITARTFMGKEGVVQIDREVDLAGPIHNKGVLTLIGFLGGTYATQMPLSLSAQITFEQNYGDIEGDSAASTELFALLSSLSGIPIKQGIAVTGSVNQLGEIQAVGGVTEKVEGWFDLCVKRGLSGDQGVIVPQGNVKDLMLKQAARDAVRAGEFHVWAAATVDDGLEILTGRGASEVHTAAKKRMKELAEGIEAFGKEEANGDEA